MLFADNAPGLDWNERTALPRTVRAVLSSLRLDPPPRASFAGWTQREWKQVLQFCDRMRITLVLADLWRDEFPGWVQRRTDQNIADNRERQERQWLALDELESALRASGVEYLVLKGFTHGRDYVAAPWLRVQCDFDLFRGPGTLDAARRVLTGLGYEAIAEWRNFPLDHLPAMVRKTGYRWQGDFFDPNLPVAIEPHFRLWDEDTEKLPASGLDRFWERRTQIRVAGRALPALDPCDRISYAALHALRHLLRGDLSVFHLYEVAHFLHAKAHDEPFWAAWADQTSPEVRRYCAVVFQLARMWFGCACADRLAREISELPKEVQQWYGDYAAAPLENQFRPNKHELWLHLALLPKTTSVWPVIRRKLVPRSLPAPVAGVLTPNAQKTILSKGKEQALYLAHLARRASHHARALPSLLEGFVQIGCGVRLSMAFWTYLGAATLFHLGLFVFVILYNLHLLDLGYQENFLGLLSTAMALGSIAGTLPAGWLAQRTGLRPMLLVCFSATPLVAACRSVVSGEQALIGAAFLHGVLFAFWAVCIAPVVAQLVPEDSRPRAFSIFFSLSIAMGIAGGLLGGQLPDWIALWSPASDWTPKQVALLIGCAIMATSLLLGSRIGNLAKPQREVSRYPRNPFIKRFLPVILIWNLATGAFNPFFNVYFAQHLQLQTSQIGQLFSLGQLTQAGAVLLAPILLVRFGVVRGIAALQGATGLGLALLALQQPLWLPCLAYLLYMSFQWMSEPGIHSLLMQQVDENERTAASSLNYVTVFSAHAAAAALAGWAITRWDYSTVLVIAGGLAVAAGLLFRITLGSFVDQSRTGSPARGPMSRRTEEKAP